MFSSCNIGSVRAWLNGNGMFYETFICFFVSEANFISVFVHRCLITLNDVEYTTFKCLSRKSAIVSLLFLFNECFIKHCVIV